MRILLYLVGGLFAVVILLAGIGLFLPAEVHLERSIVVDAPASTVFTILNGFTRMNEWSPWAQIDPAAVYTITGPSHGVGAQQAWQSNHRDVGSGKQEITASIPFERIETHLDFGPQGLAQATYQLTPRDEGTHVTWAFDTDFGINLMGRYFGLMFESMLGPAYEEGLSNLKQLAESLPQVDFADLDAEIVDLKPQTIAFVSVVTSQDKEEIAPAFARAYAEVEAFMDQEELTVAGPPLTINNLWEDGKFVFAAAMPIAQLPSQGAGADSGVQVKTTVGGKALWTVHTGPYDGLRQHYEKIEAYLAAHGLETTGPPWDVWISDPQSTPPEELVTHTYFPLETTP